MKKLNDYHKNEVNHEADKYRSQIERIRDPSRHFYPPMAILMHCITGQAEKFEMVDSTLEMCKTLYDSINITETSG